jgi:hypothetical protein
MRERVRRGGSYTTEERRDILDYCMEDVDATVLPLQAMEGGINLHAALVRGRYTKAVAWMESSGIPVDAPALRAIQEHWVEFRTELVSKVESEHRFDVYRKTGASYIFSYSRFDEFLVVREGLDAIWERTPRTHRAFLDGDYLNGMAEMFPHLAPLRALRKTLSGLTKLEPPAGTDGRNRSSIMAFAAKTSRNQPRTSDMIMC